METLLSHKLNYFFKAQEIITLMLWHFLVHALELLERHYQLFNSFQLFASPQRSFVNPH